MSVHGKGEEGYILLDVMIALFLIFISLGAILSALQGSVVNLVKCEDKLMTAISLRNRESDDFEQIR